ncbi:MAG: TlpA family protein disulfide reductase [Candidatus Aenigmarchaeota archaeon]|nr:TlpA family protein disulfide reductase [Candidatus Aenigmarchaeota archaeon]
MEIVLKKSTAKLLAIGCILILIGLIVSFQQSAPQVKAYSSVSLSESLKLLDPGPKQGESAPAFKATHYTGKTVDSKDLEGKPIVVYFWATWCGTCLQNFKSIDTIYGDYKGKVAFIAVNVDPKEGKGEISDYIKRHGFEKMENAFFIVDGDMLKKYYPLQTSTKYGISNERKVSFKNAGVFSKEQWEESFKSLLSA